MPVTNFGGFQWLFGIGEWANGWQVNGDLGMTAMREKYQVQVSGLKALQKAAPRRMLRLQNEWLAYVE